MRRTSWRRVISWKQYLFGNHFEGYIGFYRTGSSADGQQAPKLIYHRPDFYRFEVDPATPVLLHFDRPMDPTTLAAGVTITENGLPKTGRFTTQTGDRVVIFTPEALYREGALVEVVITEMLRDHEGRPATEDSFFFYSYSKPPEDGPTVISMTGLDSPGAPEYRHRAPVQQTARPSNRDWRTFSNQQSFRAAEAVAYRARARGSSA